eukprot:9571627-Prorocentrum_lima.AAC.1
MCIRDSLMTPAVWRPSQNEQGKLSLVKSILGTLPPEISSSLLLFYSSLSSLMAGPGSAPGACAADRGATNLQYEWTLEGIKHCAWPFF